MIGLVRNLYFTRNFYLGLTALVILFLFSYLWYPLFYGAIFSFLIFIVFLIFEIVVLFRFDGIEGSRIMANRFSNGDDNSIAIEITSHYSREVEVKVIDEIPHQFQRRDIEWSLKLQPQERKRMEYKLRPVKRGVYTFGAINIYVSFFIGLIERRYRFDQERDVAVYPSYLQMRKYELAAISKNLSQFGIKKVRRLGSSMEFEQIKDYVRGDDPRNINWKATARANSLMINQFQDEKSQQMYSLIDKGRLMKMPFKGLSLLDYAINASLVISNIAIQKGDKAGFISFSKKLSSALSASKKSGQMMRIMQGLYNQKTNYEESNFELLASYVRKTVTERSLLLLFTNFESLSSMQRQLPYFKLLASRHVLIVVFFRNTEVRKLIDSNPTQLESMYHQTIAEHLNHEKDLMIKELKKNGIYGIVSEPENLTVNTINKYLEVKARSF